MAFREVMPFEDLWSGEMSAHEVDGRRVLLIRLGDEVFAYEDRCVHLGVPMSRGILEGSVLTCSAHHYRYDPRTGRGINPANVCLKRFPVCVEDGNILVDTSKGAA